MGVIVWMWLNVVLGVLKMSMGIVMRKKVLMMWNWMVKELVCLDVRLLMRGEF